MSCKFIIFVPLFLYIVVSTSKISKFIVLYAPSHYGLLMLVIFDHNLSISNVSSIRIHCWAECSISVLGRFTDW